MKKFINPFLCLVIMVLVVYICILGKTQTSAIEKAKAEFARMMLTETGELVEMVYIAPSGKKYHEKSSCAGQNAMKIAFAEVVDKYGDCQKCVLD